jgi:hypothetical protein
MDSRRPLTATDDAANGDHGDIDEEMFAITSMPGIGERFEVRADGADINNLDATDKSTAGGSR